MNNKYQLVLESINQKIPDRETKYVDNITHKQVSIQLENNFKQTDQQAIISAMKISQNKNGIVSYLMSLMKVWNPNEQITKEQVFKDLYMSGIRFFGNTSHYEAFFETSFFDGHYVVVSNYGNGKKQIALAG